MYRAGRLNIKSCIVLCGDINDMNSNKMICISNIC